MILPPEVGGAAMLEIAPVGCSDQLCFGVIGPNELRVSGPQCRRTDAISFFEDGSSPLVAFLTWNSVYELKQRPAAVRSRDIGFPIMPDPPEPASRNESSGERLE